MLGIEKIKIDQETLVRISEIDEFRGLWLGLERHTTGLNMLGDFAAHGERFAKVFGPLKEKPFTTEMIRMLHATQSGASGGKGKLSSYKFVSNQLMIGKNEPLETAAPEDVPLLLEKLVAWVGPALDRPRELHPLMAIAVFLAVFLQISPFESGNMRVARFMVLLMMIRAGYIYAPFVFGTLEKSMDSRADQLYHGLKHNQQSLEDGRPVWDEWLRIFLVLLQDQKEVLMGKLYGKQRDLGRLPKLSAKILDLFAANDKLQMKEIERLTKSRRSTIKLRLGELVEGGYLRRHGQARATWYSLV